MGRVALLGTPLVSVSPAFLVGRISLAALMLVLILVVVLMLVGQVGVSVFGGMRHWLGIAQVVNAAGERIRDGNSGASPTALLVPLMVGYAWGFWLLGNLFDVAWRVVARIGEPIAWLRGKSRSLVYGPSASRLKKLLSGRPILLVSNRNDEADVLLQVGSAPGRLYREYVQAEFSRLGRLLERALLRPIVLGILLRAFEMVLETLALGFPIWRTLWFDYRVAPLDERPYYPATILVHERMNLDPRTTPIRVPVVPVVPFGVAVIDPAMVAVASVPSGLRGSMQEVIVEIKRQVRLRHSAYYENQAVMTRLAEHITDVRIASTQHTSTAVPFSFWEARAFWEALLVANVALTATAIWVADPDVVLWAWFAGIGGYLVPLAELGIAAGLYYVLTRRLLAHPLIIFWSFWSMTAVNMISALGAP